MQGSRGRVVRNEREYVGYGNRSRARSLHTFFPLSLLSCLFAAVKHSPRNVFGADAYEAHKCVSIDERRNRN